MEAARAETLVKSSEDTLFLLPGTILQDRYRIVRRLGKGGMGAVYEALDQRLDMVVALKETFSADDRLRRQFEQEARLLAQLDHPALPRVSDYFTQDQRAFLVMQFISGADLAEIIVTQPGPFPRQSVIAWADQLLDALIYLHSRDRQIIHRDIKPHNLKLTSSGQIALLDFGLAKAESPDLTNANSTTSIFGFTRRYSPLEQIQDQGTTPQSDIYALGATLYHLLTGVKPPDALSRAAALAESKADPLRPADEIHPAVGQQLAAILRCAMALSPNDRYKSASEFREAIRKIGRHPLRSREKETNSETRVVIGPRGMKLDPFESYSILRPVERNLVLPKPSRWPIGIATFITAVTIIFLAFSYDFGHWLDQSSTSLNDLKIESRRVENENSSRPNKPDKFHVNSGTSGTIASSAPLDRSEKRKHALRKPKIPVPSLRSALNLSSAQ